MVKINKIVTKSGDTGDTGLFGSGRVRKDSIRMEAIGSVDEILAIIGILTSLDELSVVPGASKLLVKIQNDLFDFGSELAAAAGVKTPCPIKQSHIALLEKAIGNSNSKLPALTSFILPGGSMLNAWFHMARVTTRKAERAVVKFTGESALNPLLQVYLNRLSDLFFVLARQASKNQKVSEILWKPGG